MSIEPIEVYRQKGKGTPKYYFRSQIGMRSYLIFFKKLTFEESDKLIESWIESKQIVPSEGIDLQYRLNTKTERQWQKETN